MSARSQQRALEIANARRIRRERERQQRNAASPENPAVPLDPDAWEERGWINRTDAGVRMSPRQAIGHPPIWRAINLISRGVAKLPRGVRKLDADGNDAGPDRKHPAYPLLTRKPNDAMRSYTWLSTMLFHALFRGNGYSAILRRGPFPDAIVLLDPTQTESFWSSTGQLMYATSARGEKRKIPATDVIHFKGLSFDGIEGVDVMTYFANAFGLGPAARKWLSKLMARGSTAGGLLQLPRELSPEARKKRQEEFDKYQSGLDNAFKTMALEDGAKWIRTMITPEEAGVFQMMGVDAKAVANVFGTPAHKLGDDTRNSYNSLEQENLAYLGDCLDPWCEEVEGELSDKLLTEDEKAGETRAVKLDRSEYSRGDRVAESTATTTAVNGGILLPDEGRERLGYAPLPNGEGKKLRIPVNVAVEGQAGGIPAADPAPDPAADPAADPTPATPPADSVQNAVRGLLIDRLGRLDKIHNDGLAKAQAKGAAAVADFRGNHVEKLRDALAPILPVMAAAAGRLSAHTTEEIADQLIDAGLAVEAQADRVLSLFAGG